MSEYILKTNREQQWLKREEAKKKSGDTRKVIQRWKKVFFEDSAKDESIEWHTRLMYHSNPGQEGWQKFFDEELEYVLTDQNYHFLQNMFAGSIRSIHSFDSEDFFHFFQLAFGDRFNPDHRFFLRINREKEHRKISFGPNMFFIFFSRGSNWYKGKDGSRNGSLICRFPEFYEDLLPLIDCRAFSPEEYDKNVLCDNERIQVRQLESMPYRIIQNTFFPVGEMIDKERHDACLVLFELYKKYKHLWPEFDLFVEKAQEKAESKIRKFNMRTENDE